MILAVDVGNTNIVVGGFCDEKVVFIERISTKQSATSLEYAISIKSVLELNDISRDAIEGAIISSVVPSINTVLKDAIRKISGVEPLLIGPGIKTGLSIKIDNPAQLGSDLVADAVGGISEYPLPLVIFDLGTGTTASVIDKNRDYVGGLILPGMVVSLEAFVSRAAQIPKISLENAKKVVGKNTIDCLKSGVLYGNAATIDGICDRIEDELGEPVTVVATGGLAHLIVPLCRRKVILDDELLLKGLMVIYHKNV